MQLLRTAADLASQFASTIDERDASPSAEAIAALEKFDGSPGFGGLIHSPPTATSGSK